MQCQEGGRGPTCVPAYVYIGDTMETGSKKRRAMIRGREEKNQGFFRVDGADVWT